MKKTFKITFCLISSYASSVAVGFEYCDFNTSLSSVQKCFNIKREEVIQQNCDNAASEIMIDTHSAYSCKMFILPPDREIKEPGALCGVSSSGENNEGLCYLMPIDVCKKSQYCVVKGDSLTLPQNEEKNLFSKWTSENNIIFDLSTCNPLLSERDPMSTIHCNLAFSVEKSSCITPFDIFGDNKKGTYVVDPGNREADGSYSGNSCALRLLGFKGSYQKTADTLTLAPNIRVFTELPPDRTLVLK